MKRQALGKGLNSLIPSRVDLLNAPKSSGIESGPAGSVNGPENEVSAADTRATQTTSNPNPRLAIRAARMKCNGT